MSLNDIGTSSQTFALRSVGASSVVRACTVATLPTDVEDSTLTISHERSATKANRSLVKFTRSVLDSDNNPQEISLHAVLTIPKGLTSAQVTAQISGADSMGNDIAGFFNDSSNWAITGRLANGEFS